MAARLRLVLLFCVTSVSEAVRIAKTAAVRAGIPSTQERESDLFQCDRQCRWKHGFFDRTIVGKKITVGLGLINSRQKCRCYRTEGPNTGVMSGDDLPYMSAVEFDSSTTWSGDFSCLDVCAKTVDGLRSMSRQEAMTSNTVLEVMHCGQCATCSAPEDVVVLPLTRQWITEVMTSVSADFAAPWGHGSVDRLEKELFEKGMNFSMSRPDGRTDRPTCMQCWTDNIMCTRKNCVDKCWTKFFDPNNPPSNIDNGCDLFDFNCQCLKCDEEFCGPAFIKCAGANRRAAGVVSDIERPGEQQCPMGRYSGVASEDLPTAPKPDY